ncbi:MAG: hypothetical protein C0505_02510 [Leptothrix sp. (in: Bacteria)]|nr:hypothetical protein [Leptothrix sp. (in: b-proteobacteria)]
MSPEKPSPRTKRACVASEEERAWVTFYRRVGHDLAIATEVLAQLDADPEMKRAHLALYLCCKESFRLHKARLARNKRIGQFVRWLCHGLFVRPVQALRHAGRQGGNLAVECLPEPVKEPAVPQVRQLTREPEFAQAASAFGPPATSPTATTDAIGANGAELAASASSRTKASRSAA